MEGNEVASIKAIGLRWRCAAGMALLAGLAGPGHPAAADALVYAAPERSVAAAEARQGVASDGRYFYAIDNSTIGKYEIGSGERVAEFRGDPEKFPHLNSCTLVRAELVCASSNYPALPYRNTAEFFDPVEMRHIRSASIPAELGSLTVLNWHEDHWWAFFANYDGKGGAPGKTHHDTVLTRLNPDLSVERQWALPNAVLARLAPSSISGASWGDDGLLYASGHDKPEIYVLALPSSGSVLRHARTFAVASFGQAVDFDPVTPRLLWSIDRRQRSVFATRLPPIPEVEP
jgi:hypothetical protein